MIVLLKVSYASVRSTYKKFIYTALLDIGQTKYCRSSSLFKSQFSIYGYVYVHSVCTHVHLVQHCIHIC